MKKIVKVGDSVLRQKAKPVGKVTPDIKKLAVEMVAAMKNARPKGVGIAAPQVGVSIRMIIVHHDDNDICMINPEIIKRDGECTVKEGCLSVPGLWADVVRPETITCRFKTINEKKMEIECNGALARVIQHEIDHLNGVLFIDYIKPGQEVDLDDDASMPEELIKRIMKEDIHQIGETL
jgi:peptide deformylase